MPSPQQCWLTANLALIRRCWLVVARSDSYALLKSAISCVPIPRDIAIVSQNKFCSEPSLKSHNENKINKSHHRHNQVTTNYLFSTLSATPMIRCVLFTDPRLVASLATSPTCVLIENSFFLSRTMPAIACKLLTKNKCFRALKMHCSAPRSSFSNNEWFFAFYSNTLHTTQ